MLSLPPLCELESKSLPSLSALNENLGAPPPERLRTLKSSSTTFTRLILGLVTEKVSRDDGLRPIGASGMPEGEEPSVMGVRGGGSGNLMGVPILRRSGDDILGELKCFPTIPTLVLQ